MAQASNTQESLYSRNEANSQNIKLLKANMSPSLSGPTGGAEIQVEGNALLASANRSSDSTNSSKITSGGSDEISVYTVREGDTLSEIAEMFGVKVSTIRGFNNIRKDSDLRVGMEILILPVDGVLYKVEKGDTLSSVAKKFSGDENDISLFNDLESDKLVVGSEIVIPNGKEPEVKVTTSSKTTSSKTTTSKTTNSKSSSNTSGYASYPAGFYVHPIPVGAVKSQGFHGPYQAQDLAARTGTPIVASSAGRVTAVRTGWSGGYGNMIIIDDGRAQVLYAHLSKIDVTQGQVISQGQKIGEVGSTGRSTGPHLHIEYRGKGGPMKTPTW